MTPLARILAASIQQREEAMTICYNCVHCDRTHASAVCNAPALRGRQTMNYVTGDLVRKRPLCVDVNKDGKCPHFELPVVEDAKPLPF